MVYSCVPLADVPVQGKMLYAQRSDHVCALAPTCTWAMDLASVHKTVADRTALRRDKDKTGQASGASAAGS